MAHSQRLDLFCPRCEHPLVGLGEAGLGRCPECGAEARLDELRRWRFGGYPLGDYWTLFWNVVLRAPRFIRSLPAPRYYLRAEGADRYLAGAVNVTLGAGLVIVAAATVLVIAFYAGTGLQIPYSVIALVVSWPMPFVYTLGIWLAHVATIWWLCVLLSAAGRPVPLYAARQVALVASPILVAVALNACLLMIGLGVMAWSFPAGLTVVWVAGLAHLALWLDWARAARLMFDRQVAGRHRFLSLVALLNPGLVIGVGLPVAAAVWLAGYPVVDWIIDWF